MSVEIKLNSRNSELLEDLRKDFQIDFVQIDNNSCGVFTQNNHSTIYYNPKIIDDESIAHELLHVWLKKYNYHIGNHIYLSCQNHKKLNKILSKTLCDYIENCFDHFKMYPKYHEMGYGDDKFLVNGLAEKCSLQDIKLINLRFLGKYNSKSVDRFIGCLISIYADHVDNDYEKHLKAMKKKEPDLFQIVTKFWNKWVHFDIENIDPIYNSDLQLVESFIVDMEDWSDNRMIR